MGARSTYRAAPAKPWELYFGPRTVSHCGRGRYFDVTDVSCNRYAQRDEQRYALNAAPIRRLSGRNGSAMGEYAPAGIDQL